MSTNKFLLDGVKYEMTGAKIYRASADLCTEIACAGMDLHDRGMKSSRWTR